MNTTSKRARVVYLLVALLLIGTVYLGLTLMKNGESWAMNHANRHIYNGNTMNVAGTIYDSNKNVLVSSKNGKRVYNDDENIRKAMLHLTGDSEGFISTGIQNLYKKELVGYNILTGLYTADQIRGNDIRLTVNSDVSKTAFKALGNKKGAVSVYNYKTGEIICMVSTPTYDPENKPQDIESDKSGKYDGIYLNRCLSSSYTPGSTFKIVTAAAALENIPDIQKQVFHCDGSCSIGNGKVICNGVHGDINFTEALNQSCNVAFANIGLQLGRKKLTEQAEKMGFNSVIQCDRVNLAKSTFDVSHCDDVDLGWASIGQYTTLANPIQMMMACGGIANGGNAVQPYFIKSVRSSIGIPYQNGGFKKDKEMMSSSTAQQLSNMMHLDVVNKYGEDSFPGIKLAAKTGTAQIDNDIATSWFVGFTMDDKCPLAFSVVVEQGGAGMSTAGPIANKVLQSAYRNLKK